MIREEYICKQDVLNKIREVCFSKEWALFRIENGTNGQRDFLINYIEQLQPDITPKSKIGHWIGGDGNYICSCCKRDPLDFLEPEGLDGGSYMDTPMKYCPHCGAKMSGWREE